MTVPILEIKNVVKEYGHTSKLVRKRALDGVYLDIYKGEIISLLGVNGAGKTTLSSIIATLHPPTSGEILFKGVSIYKDIMNYRKALGFCPQKPNLDEYLNVRENLEFAGRYYLLPEKEVQERVNELMTQFDLHKYASFKTDALSGGWRHRVLIARALVHNPEIVILDEPTVGLDPDVRRVLWKYIQKLKSRGITVILTTHYLDEAEYLSDRVCIMDRGKTLLVTTVNELKTTHQKSNLEEAFLSLVEKEQARLANGIAEAHSDDDLK